MALKNKGLVFSAMLAFFAICFVAPVFAANNFVVNYQDIQRIITEDQRAVFNLTVFNLQNTSDSFNIMMENDLWSLTTDPLYVYQTKYGLSVDESNSTSNSSSVQMFLSPAKKLAPGMYRVHFTVTSKNTGEIDEQSFLITIRNLQGFGEYIPTIRADLSVADDGKVDPRNKAVFYVKIDNLNPINISDLGISLAGDKVSKDIETTIGPLEQKTETLEIGFDPLEAPATKEYRVTVRIGGEVQKIMKASIEILPYSELEKSVEAKTQFLRKQTTYTYKNNGNVNRKETISAKTAGSRKLFTKTFPEASVVDSDSGVELRWYVNLRPQETYSVTVKEDYRFLFFALLALIIAIVLYYLLRSPIVMKKEATVAAGTAQDGISEIKVLIYIQNRARTQFRSVKVLDKIPGIAELKDEFIAGTLKPSKVLRHEKKGTIIEWSLQTIEPYEERIISYKIKSKLSILGLFNLPPAMVKFVANGREKSILSNKVNAAKEKHKRFTYA